MQQQPKHDSTLLNAVNAFTQTQVADPDLETPVNQLISASAVNSERTRPVSITWYFRRRMRLCLQVVPPHSGVPPVRDTMLGMVDFFFQRAIALTGVDRIALVGSITTAKPEPKDLDLLVTVHRELSLADLARLGRQSRGRLQSINRGCDVFLADRDAGYIGRLCIWKTCAPGIRLSCDAQHCGRRAFLHDDFDDVFLPEDLVHRPPVELWPKLVVRCPVSDDLALLLARLDRRIVSADSG